MTTCCICKQPLDSPDSYTEIIPGSHAHIDCKRNGRRFFTPLVCVCVKDSNDDIVGPCGLHARWLNEEIAKATFQAIPDDWTTNQETGMTNSSPLFKETVLLVGRMIRDGAHSLINGGVETVATTIVAGLAHKYGFVPKIKR